VDEVLAVGDAEFQRKCLGKMNDVAQQGRTVLFVSHNMSAILRLTQEAIVLKKGQLIKRAPTPEAVDFYLSSGQAESGERVWEADEVPAASAPFGRSAAAEGSKRQGRGHGPLHRAGHRRMGISTRCTGHRSACGDVSQHDARRICLHLVRYRRCKAIRTVRRAPGGALHQLLQIPADFFNEGRYSLGVNASSFGVRRYFMDENALSFNVDISGAPGTQWPEVRQGPIRPRWIGRSKRSIRRLTAEAKNAKF
jgi:lipopolysaccharide transport system ATP-binding protein